MRKRNLNVVTVPISAWRILPPAPDVCQVCACDHPPELPHNRDSLYYQTAWAIEHEGASPTWADAMAHCTPDVREQWTRSLEALGALEVSP